MESLALARLLQLASPALPIGAYSYSQGLEWAIEAGTVHDEATALTWINDLLDTNIGRFEAPTLATMMRAWQGRYDALLRTLNADFLASRETSELRAETVQMGYSLLRLLEQLNPQVSELSSSLINTQQAEAEPSFPLVWSAAAVAWNIAEDQAVLAYLWAWAENQTLAAVKAIPLGQTAGQRMLLALGAELPRVARDAQLMNIDDTTNFAPAFAIASSRHETQYSRLFRS